MLVKLKDPGSAITHFLGVIFAIVSAVPLLIRAASNPDRIHIIALAIYITSMFLLYSASTIYHSLNLSEKINTILRKIDHMMIFVLIAGSYTPVCLIVLQGKIGWLLFGLVWGIAIIGISINALWITCPKWFSSALYIAMGWVCVLAFSPIINSLPKSAFLWLLAGGILYTIGGILYALKLSVFNNRHKYFGSHEIFHLFVLAGSICHFIMMYQYVAIMPL